MARYLNENVPGIEVSEHLLAEIAAATDPVAAGVEIAARTIREIRPLCQGVHIMAIGQESLIPAILERADYYSN